LALYSGQTASRILATDAEGLFESLDLSSHLTPQRSNGVRSMVERIKNDARAAV
jgi:cysteine desulfuration protein SufE